MARQKTKEIYRQILALNLSLSFVPSDQVFLSCHLPALRPRLLLIEMVTTPTRSLTRVLPQPYRATRTRRKHNSNPKLQGIR
eukprot:780178-Amorphochlora_amoeboformis.AAC.1